jgi:hypothetical protein
MRLIRNCTIGLLAATSLSACQPTVGGFCAAYMPVGPLNDEAATALIQHDRSAAESIAVNEETYQECL